LGEKGPFCLALSNYLVKETHPTEKSTVLGPILGKSSYGNISYHSQRQSLNSFVGNAKKKESKLTEVGTLKTKK
jgi:hypothetical protein